MPVKHARKVSFYIVWLLYVAYNYQRERTDIGRPQEYSAKAEVW